MSDLVTVVSPWLSWLWVSLLKTRQI